MVARFQMVGATMVELKYLLAGFAVYQIELQV